MAVQMSRRVSDGRGWSEDPQSFTNSLIIEGSLYVKSGQPWFDVRAYGARGDGVANDTAAIQAAIAAAAATGGRVFLPAGSYAVTSTGRTDAVSYAGGGSLTISDTSITAGDIGSYCVGAGINGRAVKITAVNPGVSFTVDIAPAGTPTSLLIVKPAFVLPEGVSIVGVGAGLTNNGFAQPPYTAVSKIVDSGNGITCLVRGAAGNQAERYSIQDIAIWGNANSTVFGIYVGNMSWFFVMHRCDISYHGVAGIALDGNCNSDTIQDCFFLNNGTTGATGFTGAVLMFPYSKQPSAAVNFINCFFDASRGWGVCDGQGLGAQGINLIGCQWNNTVANAAANSGMSARLNADGNGRSTIVGGWTESAAVADLWTNGSVLVSGVMIGSSTPWGWHIDSGQPTAISCRFSNHTSFSVDINYANGGGINWSGCEVTDPFFFSGGPVNAGAAWMGSTLTVQSSRINGNGQGISPQAFGSGTPANSIFQGSGVPPNANGNNGDTYLRTDTPGTVNQRIYVKSAGAWVGIL